MAPEFRRYTEFDGDDVPVLVIPKVFGDNRGYFMESYNYREYLKGGIRCKFAQDNESFSEFGVLRGLHAQERQPQGKLVRVVHGEVYDVALDIRPESRTFGKYIIVKLSADNKHQLYVPEGFLHGFVVVSGDGAIFAYKCTDYYDPESEIGVIYNDQTLNIDWPLDPWYLKVSEKDQQNMPWPELVAKLQPKHYKLPDLVTA